MATEIEINNVIRATDDNGQEYILYPVTKGENLIGTIDAGDLITLKLKQGAKENMPDLDNGEPFVTTDTRELFIGGVAGALNLKGEKGDKGERGLRGEKGDTGPQGPPGESGEGSAVSDAHIINLCLQNLMNPHISERASSDKLGHVEVDTALSDLSENPVQNKAVTNALNEKMDSTFFINGYTTINEITSVLEELRREVAALKTAINK